MAVTLNHAIIGTAGHIDHGKTALIKALTGFDADTLAEEKRRGITIELGFAFLDTGFGREIVFIDVPGHEKLIKTMVAGASNLDAVLFVIAADEGISVQTIEHLDILKLLAIRSGIIALTKSDLVDDEHIRRVTADVKHLVADSFLDNAPIIPVSSVTGTGVDEVKSAIIEVARNTETRQDSGVFRMPIDRIFTMQGFGAVIAGTILSGEVKVGDRVEILPDGLSARVRGIQVHGESIEKSIIGIRTAVNLQDVKKEQIRRGQCACAPGSLTPTSRMDARLYVLKGPDDEVKNRMRVRLHVGTDEIMCRVIPLEGERIAPGETALVQLVLESPTTALPRDRFVIRTFSSTKTIGGGVIIDPHPARHKRFDESALESLEKREGDLQDVVEQAVLKSGVLPLTASEVAQAIGESEESVAEAISVLLEQGNLVRTVRSEKYIHSSHYMRLVGKLIETLREFYAREPYRLLMPMVDLQARFLKLADKQVFETILYNLIQARVLVRRDQKVGLTDHESALTPAERDAAQRIELIYREGLFATPPEEDVMQQMRLGKQKFENIMSTLIDEGKLVRLSERVTYHTEHLDRAREFVVDFITKHGAITAAELRDELGVTRKYAIGLLEYFDSIFLTRRVGDKRMLKRM